MCGMIYSPIEFIVGVIEREVKRIIREEYGLDVDVVVEEEKKFGDFSFKCFSIAKRVSERPDAVAKKIKSKFSGQGLSFLDKIECAGGYVNFTLSSAELAKVVFSSIKELGAKYGFNPVESPISIIVEHTSANPIHPLHIGHLRNCCLGDSLARILELRGHRVSRHFYIDDVGLQVAYAAYGYSKLGMPDPPTKPDHFIGYIYACTYNIVEIISLKKEIERLKSEGLFDEYEQKLSELDETLGILSKLEERNPEVFKKLLDSISSDPDPEEKVSIINRLYEQKDPDVVDIVRKTVKLCLEGFKETLSRLGVFFDSWDWESDVVWSGLVDRVIEGLRSSGFVFRKKGALIFDANRAAELLELKSLLGLSPRYEIPSMVLVRSDGSTLYTTRDIAYTIMKFEKARRVINVIGVEQKLAQLHLKIALCVLGYKEEALNLVHYAYEHVKLAGARRMSSRRGEIITIDELLDEAVTRARAEIEKRSRALPEEEKEAIAEAVGVGALKYAMLSVSPTKTISFDWKRVLDFSQNSGPFLQYAYVRAHNILAKSGLGEKALFLDADFSLLSSKEERQLIKYLGKFPAIVAKAADDLRPDYIVDYANGLAKQFNLFYDNYPVLSAENEELKKARLVLVASTAIVMRNALNIIGIKPIARM